MSKSIKDWVSRISPTNPNQARLFQADKDKHSTVCSEQLEARHLWLVCPVTHKSYTKQHKPTRNSQ